MTKSVTPHPRDPRAADIAWRELPTHGDGEAIARLCRRTGFFRSDEIEIAESLLQETLELGAQSGYSFVFAEQQGEVVGYCCYGLIPCTVSSFDLYWIVVDPALQEGVGRRLLELAERRVGERGGRRVYIETSARPQYASTQQFYLRCGYREEARLEHFYAEGDDKLIYCRVLARS